MRRAPILGHSSTRVNTGDLCHGHAETGSLLLDLPVLSYGIMSGEIYRLPRLAERGVEIAIPILEPEVWDETLRADRGLPASYPELHGLVETLFFKGNDRAGIDETRSPQEVAPFETCGESLFARVYKGLGNPRLSQGQRDAIDSFLAEATPSDWHTRSTPHFLLRWTDSDAHADHNLTDPNLIDEAAELLERAWQILTPAFGREPFGSQGGGQIQVDFLDLPGVEEGQAYPPGGPIQLDARIWQDFPAKRAPLAAHELFHKLQYSFGFRIDWAQTATNVDWFSEGTARWAEVFVHQRLTAAKWLTSWMGRPRADLFNTGSFALPFWIFFDARLRSASAAPLLDLLTACSGQQDARLGLDQALGGVHEDLPSFFARFGAESFLGETRRLPDGQLLYPVILGLDGQPVDPRPAATTARLDAGGSFQSAAVSIGGFGACYHALSFAPGAEGRPLRLEAQAGVDVSYTLISLSGGRKVGEMSTVSDAFVHAQTIRLATADTLVLIASGRGTPAGVEVGARVG